MKPILFNTDMVQAITSGRKTQTRRPTKFKGVLYPNETMADYARRWNYNSYKIGDTLYVRETWNENPYGSGPPFAYKAEPETWYHDEMSWRPSIHMPRKAARLFLKVTDIYIEPVKSITEDGAEREGFCQEVYDDGSYLTARGKFKAAWVGLYGKAHWDKDDWVWVITFEVIDVWKEELI